MRAWSRFRWLIFAVTMGVDHGRRQGVKSPPRRIWSGEILSCCKMLSTRLLALQCRKMCFCLYSRTFIVSPAMRPPRIPVRSTPIIIIIVEIVHGVHI